MFEAYPNQDRLSMLYGYEDDGGTKSKYYQQPHLLYHEFKYSMSSATKFEWHYFEGWLQGKREFTKEEITGLWVKISDKKTSRQVRFSPDGTLTENHLFSPTETWPGTWKLIGGVLRINIGIYELDVIAAKNGLHSGIEFEDHKPYAYFKVIHVQGAT